MPKFNQQTDFQEIIINNPLGNLSNGVLHELKFIQEPFIITQTELTNGYVELSHVPENSNNVQMEVLGAGQQLNSDAIGSLVIDVDFEMDTVSPTRLYFKSVPPTPNFNDAHNLPTLPFIDGEEILVSYYYVTGL